MHGEPALSAAASRSVNLVTARPTGASQAQWYVEPSGKHLDAERLAQKRETSRGFSDGDASLL